MSGKKKKTPASPKVRHTWQIRPATQVTPSAKIYHRPGQKKQIPTWVDDVDWYGEEV